MSKCCGCFLGVGGSFPTKKKPLDDCWVKYDFKQGSGNFTLPRAGIYQLMLSSNNANVLNALDLEIGTAFAIVDVPAKSTINYTLGATSHLTLNQYVLNTDAVTNTSKYSAGLIVRYVGEKWNSIPASIIRTSEYTGFLGNNSEWVNLRYSDKVNPYTMHEYAIVPSLTQWKNYPNLKEHWYYADVNFPTSGNYTFRSFGDDVGQMLFDGKPIIWGIPSKGGINRTLSNYGNSSPVSSGGHTTFYVEKGTHQIIVYNKQTGEAIDVNLQSVVNESGEELLSDLSIFRKIEKQYGCNNDPVLPVMEYDTSNIYISGSGTSTNM